MKKKITKILIPIICLTIVLISFCIIFFIGSDENETIIILHAGGGTTTPRTSMHKKHLKFTIMTVINILNTI